MSSQIALVASEPLRTPSTERVSRSGRDEVPGAGLEHAEELAPRVAVADETTSADVEAPDLETAVDNIRDFVADVRRELQFSVDKDSGRTIITVIDSDSGQIIRQIPPEEVMKIAKSVADGAFNLIDSRV